jgi:hypothetical protein
MPTKKDGQEQRIPLFPCFQTERPPFSMKQQDIVIQAFQSAKPGFGVGDGAFNIIDMTRCFDVSASFEMPRSLKEVQIADDPTRVSGDGNFR